MIPLLLLSALLVQSVPRDPAAAMVLSVQGKVELQRAWGEKRRLGEMDFLYPGDRLRPQGDGRAVLVFVDDEHREQVKGPATVAQAGCKPPEAVEVLRKPGPEMKAVLDGLKELDRSGRAAGTVFRSPSDDERPAVTPVDGSRVLTDRPAFTWRPVPKVKGYRIEVFKKADLKVKPEWTADPTEARWTYPRPLPRGREYAWRVYAVTDEEVRPCAGGGFYLVGAGETGDLEKLQTLAAGDDAGDLVLAAVGYEGQQAYGEALAAYERLCRRAPHAAAFQAARAALLERAGRTEEAKKAWADAEKAGFVLPAKP
jgi:hypothetical protein